MENDSAFNSPNPFGGANQPGYDSTMFTGNIGGPINKKASFFLRFPTAEHQQSFRR